MSSAGSVRGLVIAAAMASTLVAQSTVGTALSAMKAGAVAGLPDNLDDFDQFGVSAASIGDFDGDGTGDVAIGALFDDNAGKTTGAVWLLFLDADRRVKERRKVAGFAPFFNFGSDHFSASVTALGDVDGDGVTDLAVGAPFDGVGNDQKGAVWILFLTADGGLKAQQKINASEGGLAGALVFDEQFGVSVVGLGDLDGDGVPDLAVGGTGDNDGGSQLGAVWMLFLNVDGTVKHEQKISATAGGFGAGLTPSDAFGSALANLGDLDGDGVIDLAVGARLDDGGNGTMQWGAVWILFLQADGTVKARQKIGTGAGGFTGTLGAGDTFGSSIATLGDLDGDGVVDLAVGAPRDDGRGIQRGAVWIVLLAADGTVKQQQRISEGAGGFTGSLDNFDFFGSGVATPGDLDGDGTLELLVGAPSDDDGGVLANSDRGAAWVLSLDAAGFVQDRRKIDDVSADFAGTLDQHDGFGRALAALGDLDGNGVQDVAVGVPGDDDGGVDRGAVRILRLAADGAVASHGKISAATPALAAALHDGDAFGCSVIAVGDLDGDGVRELAVGAMNDDDGGAETGAVWILFLTADGGVKDLRKISALGGGFTGALDPGDLFGHSVAALGDLDGDGVADLAVGASHDDDGGAGGNRGAVWILFLHADGSVKAQRKISATTGGFTAVLNGQANFGDALAGLGDLDGDGVADLAVGMPFDNPFVTSSTGVVYVLMLHADGTVKSWRLINQFVGGLGGLSELDQFGGSVAAPGDLDGDGVGDLVVGAPRSHISGIHSGAVYVLFMQSDGGVKWHQKLGASSGGFAGSLAHDDRFGQAVAALGDIDGDGMTDLAIGATGDDDDDDIVGDDKGAAWVVLLKGSAWTNLGSDLAGVHGIPVLAGMGDLAPLSLGSLDLLSAAPSAPAVLFVSLASVPTAFKGGTLVPVPPLLSLALGTSAAGKIALPFTWPMGLPSALGIYFQYAIKDAAAPLGVSLSNALRSTTP